MHFLGTCILLDLIDQLTLLVCRQILVVLEALSMAKDEIMWLVRHACNSPPKGRKLNQEDYVDV